jgi:hypothetical protein
MHFIELVSGSSSFPIIHPPVSSFAHITVASILSSLTTIKGVLEAFADLLKIAPGFFMAVHAFYSIVKIREILDWPL